MLIRRKEVNNSKRLIRIAAQVFSSLKIFFLYCEAGTMILETDKIAVGIRFKMNNLGAVRCPNLADKNGIVVGVSRRTTGVAVLFDGDRRPTFLHRDYITQASD
jgi:hypothetical protein